jgi:hypothetical protein
MTKMLLPALAAAVVAVAATAAAGTPTRTSCPAALPPGANPIAPASRAAFTGEPKSSKPQVIAAALAPNDPDRGPQAKRECGAQVWQRTVVVHITLRAFLPSASLSERVDFVARTASGWRVWEVVH